ncbi:MAG: dihydrodipicolinate synthase family protein, partial [Rickettsia endosymbiont of Ixodes ricinus]|nr:dihydrodipicolinate synthase family protein [Rickettsia endosymbiont of Ixodes ricinus]
MYNIFKGLITALITPFKDNKLDLYALERILKHQIKHEVDAVLIAGSTGEGSSLSFAEYKLLLQTSVEIKSNGIRILLWLASD